MRSILISLMSTVLAGFRTRLALQIEILALQHQIIVLRGSVSSRPKLPTWDRFLWIWLLRLWPEWCSALIIVRPETVIAWHRKGLRLFWTWKSRRGPSGRPRISRDIRELIRTMSKADVLWGAPDWSHPARLPRQHHRNQRRITSGNASILFFFLPRQPLPTCIG
jgi:hypothetical protein